MRPQELKKAGLKVTLPRVKVLEILENSPQRHLSAEAVYHALHAAGNDVGLATVYRVLTQFEAAGLVSRRHFEGGQAVFEIESGQHHDHMVCVKCGRVEEFVDETIEKCQRDVAANGGHKLVDHSLVLYIECAACRGGQDNAQATTAAG